MLLKSLAKKVVKKVGTQLRDAGPFGQYGGSFNILDIAAFQAALDSATYLSQHMANVAVFDDGLDLLAFAFREAKVEGSVLEFGVASGRTINFLAGLSNEVVDGFDSFKGLPEDWRPGFEAGAFSQEIPPTASNVRLHVGMFDATLPGFLAQDDRPVSLLHIDCDLYSSTRIVLDSLRSRMVEGTMIVFDEYWNYPGWRMHEWKAFQEFVASPARRYEYVGFVPKHQQVAVRIVE